MREFEKQNHNHNGIDTRDRVSVETDLFDLEHKPYLWRTILRKSQAHQMEKALVSLRSRVTLESDVHHILSDPFFSEAQSILEVGCGSGDFLFKLSGFFKDKTFIGIDESSERISIAKNRYDYHCNLKYRCQKLSEIRDEKYNFIIIRNFESNVDDDNLLKEARALLVDEGQILLVRPAHELQMFSPQVSSLNGSPDQVGVEQKELRNEGCFRQFGLLEVSREVVPVSIIEKSEKRNLFTQVMIQSERSDRQGGSVYDQRDLYSELMGWLKFAHSYCQTGVQYLRLAKWTDLP